MKQSIFQLVIVIRLVQMDVTKKVYVCAKKGFLAKDVINANMDFTVILHANVCKIDLTQCGLSQLQELTKYQVVSPHSIA